MNDSFQVKPWEFQDGKKVIVIEHTRDDPRPGNTHLTTIIYVPVDMAAELVDKILDVLVKSV